MIRLDRAFIQNPHDLYRRLRADGPVARVVMWGAVPVWLVTRYTEAKALLNDPRLSKDHARLQMLFPPGTGGAHTFPVNATMLMTDPPDHTRLRRLVLRAFTSRAVADGCACCWPTSHACVRSRIEKNRRKLLRSIGAIEGEVPQRGELALDPVQPRGHCSCTATSSRPISITPWNGARFSSRTEFVTPARICSSTSTPRLDGLAGAMTYSSVKRLLSRCAKRINYDLSGPHKLRHTCRHPVNPRHRLLRSRPG